MDCGDEFEVPSKNTKTIRCIGCTKKHENQYQKELMRKRKSRI